MKIQKVKKLLTKSETIKNGKTKIIFRVQEFNETDIKNFIDEDKFKKNESQTLKNPRHEANVYVIYCDDFDEMESQMEDSKSKIQSLEDQILEKDKSIESLEKELSAIQEKHKKELKKVKDELNGQVESLKEEVHDKDIEIEKEKTEFEKEIGQINKAHLNHIHELNIFDEEKHITIKDYQNQMNKLYEKIEDLKSKLFDKEKHMKIRDHNLAVNGIKNRIVENLIPHNDNINRLDRIGTLGLWKGELKDVRKDLKKDIQAFEDIAHYIESKEKKVIFELKKEEKEDDDSS